MGVFYSLNRNIKKDTVREIKTLTTKENWRYLCHSHRNDFNIDEY